MLGTVAGPEIGVASTKAFTAQLAVLACFALAAGRAAADSAEQEARDDGGAAGSAGPGGRGAGHDQHIQRLAVRVAEARDVLYLGRGACFPIAMEGALKLKEISTSTPRATLPAR